MMINHPFQVRQPLSENVARFIRKEILLGRWKRGAHINESKIATELNVSRGPVRDALKLLNNEGMIETPSNGRAIVIGFDEKNFNDWNDIRLYLETLAIKEGIKKIPAKQMNFIDMERTIVEMERADNLASHIYFDLLFHKSIVDFSGNRTLSKLWDTISGTLSTMLELIANHYDNKKQIDMHKNILEALKAGDAEKACRELEFHIREGEKANKSVIAFMDEQDD
ncbi:GntR family transcriptional regulator [bacterium LRH843]|nr:GntR family transcriptional regulator [bacterium LRH843]